MHERDETTDAHAPAAGLVLDKDAVSRLLEREYDLTVVSQQELGGESDRNIKIETDNGIRYVLKVSAGTPDDADKRWHIQVLIHLATAVPHIAAPRSVPSRTGSHLVSLSDGDIPAVARLMTWVEGSMLVEVKDHPPALLRALGQTAAQLAAALQDIEAPTDLPSHHWDLRATPAAIALGLPFVEDPTNRRHVEIVSEWFAEAETRFADLPQGVVHHDLNDHNVLVEDREGGPVLSGILDVGDTIETLRVAELAVCVAYAMLRKDEPLAAAVEVVAGFDSVVSLTDQELAVIFPLAAARLCTNAVTWTRRVAEANTKYGAQRMAHTWPTLARIVTIPPPLAEAALRLACGRPGSAASDALSTMLTSQGDTLAETISITEGAPLREVDLGPGGDLYDGLDWIDDEALQVAFRIRTAAGAFAAHLTPSLLCGGRRRVGPDGPATYQLGVSLFLPAGTRVLAPQDGIVEQSSGDGSAPLVLRHEARTPNGDQQPYWTRWFNLPSSLAPPMAVTPGDSLGIVQSGGTPNSAVQVQVFTDPRLVHGELRRWVRAEERAWWSSLFPDPASLLGLRRAFAEPPSVEQVVRTREAHLASSQRSYYAQPMKLVRGRGVWLYDESARAYLDSINNVTHVGHAEPRVAATATRQLSRLNTNSRFVYQAMASYAERLTATLPAGLDVVFLVCTGSEANDLALRIARQVTRREDVIVIDGAYHGNTTAVNGISPNRYKGKGGAGRPPTTHEVPTPDRYRGPYGYSDEDAGRKYGAAVGEVVSSLSARGRPPAAFIAESLLGTAGCIELPPDYLSTAFEAVREPGGLCISDEVQVGVGRLGSAFWGFELQGVVPDIVTMGKPLGNGHPLAAVVTTREIADAFDNGAKYFNTFGGSPVSCAVGETVLRIVEEDGLQQHALDVGDYFRQQLLDLAAHYPSIGDVRARGLYLGIDLVSDPVTRAPDAALAIAVAERLKDDGIITYPTGVSNNVLKVKPPMVFGPEHVDLYVHRLERALCWYADGPS